MLAHREDDLAPATETADRLRGHPLWAKCRSDTIDLLLRRSERRVFSSREALIQEGAEPRWLHVVLSGAVELYSRYRRQETEFVVIEPPHSFIMAAVLMDRPQLTSARVFERSELLLVPALAVRRAFEADETFARTAALEMAHCYRAVTREVKSQTLLTSVERLAKWLVERDAATGGRHVVRAPFDKRGLAARLGMVPEVFSRSLATLAKNHIRVHGGAIEICDPEALARLAASHPPLFYAED